jgi:hypothetical protein
MFSSSNSNKQIIPINNKEIKAHPLKNETAYNIRVTDSIHNIKEIWDSVAPKENLFLQSTYLKTLEDFRPEKMSFKYVIFYKDNLPVGISYNQIYRLKIEDSLQEQHKDGEEPKSSYCVIEAISKSIKKWFIKRADFNLLICGNLLLTGEYGFYFKDESLNSAGLIQDSLDTLQTILATEQTKISIHLIKDYKVESSQPLETELKKTAYHPFSMQPCMYMDVRPNWLNFDDYLNDMSSKYRVRAKRARKKGTSIVKKEFSLEEIEANEERIHELYKMIADGVGFNAFLLHKKYFTELKRSLKENYKLTAYYIDGEIVAFYTSIFNYHEMDAHFLGVDSSYNRTHQVYLNILYDLVNEGIEAKSKRIDFARTALEIKSSVGAVAQEMICFFKHQGTISGKILPLVFDSLNPKEEWQPRSPFKVTSTATI